MNSLKGVVLSIFLCGAIVVGCVASGLPVVASGFFGLGAWVAFYGVMAVLLEIKFAVEPSKGLFFLPTDAEKKLEAGLISKFGEEKGKK